MVIKMKMSTSIQSPIDLARGCPAISLLPTEGLSAAAATSLSDPRLYEAGLEYGAEAGFYPMRVALADWLSKFYASASPDDAERICITGGASQSLASILQLFTHASITEKVWVVQPIYHLALGVLEDAGLGDRLVGVPENTDGVDVDYFERCLRSSASVKETPHLTSTPKPSRKYYKHVFYLVPTFSNPSGTVLPIKCRERLVRLAREFDILLIADDVYDFLHWSRASTLASAYHKAIVPRLVDVDRTLDGGPIDKFGNAISNGSFSKIIGPGCRVGWVEGTAAFVLGLASLGSTISGGAPSQFTSTIIFEMISNSSLNRHIQDVLLLTYRRRHNLIVSAIENYLLPLSIEFGVPVTETSGGMFVWIALPPLINEKTVIDDSLVKENLTVIGGRPFFYPNCDMGGKRGHLRLCFAWEEEDKMVEGIVRLSKVIKSLLNAV